MPKPGFISPSRIKDMMTEGRGKSTKWGDTAFTYARELALERIGIELPDSSYGKAIDWGNEHEDMAIEAYERNKLVEVHSQQVWQQHPEFEKVGGTPDGLIGKEGGMDAKCPYSITNHMANMLDNAQLKQYNYQFQGYMWITGRTWWDFVSFDPRYLEGLKIHSFRVERDDALIAKIEERYRNFEMIVEGFKYALLEKVS